MVVKVSVSVSASDAGLGEGEGVGVLLGGSVVDVEMFLAGDSSPGAAKIAPDGRTGLLLGRIRGTSLEAGK